MDHGTDKTFTMKPNSGCTLADVKVDGVSVLKEVALSGGEGSYTFSNVKAPHTIEAVFLNAAAYSDVKDGDWFKEAVDFVTREGLMNGTGGGKFSPYLTTSRGMIVTMLWRLEQQPAAPLAAFADLEQGAYYWDAVAWASEKGIVTGYSNGLFGPADPISREQLAAILYRYAGSPAVSGDLSAFPDAAEASGYALNALLWATRQGIITGKSGGLLDPQGQATRAETAAMFMRYLQGMAK